MTSQHNSIARMIDHTVLKPEATAAEIEQACREALEYQFAAVCVNSAYVPLCVQLLAGRDVKVASVTGFPLGASLTAVKVYEAQQAIENGALEIDMVMNIGALKNRDLTLLEQDIAQVTAACHAHGAILKVIFETVKLSDEEKVLACQASMAAGADFVKTSTGFAGGGATVADVRLMRQTVGPKMGVKAAGGVRTIDDARAMIEAGATRIGSSAGVAIVKSERGETAASGPATY